MVENISNLTAGTGLLDLVVYDNQVTGGLLTLGFVIVMFFILLSLSSKNLEFDKALLFASFGSFIISVLMTSINLLNFSFVFGFGALLALTGLWVYISGRK